MAEAGKTKDIPNAPPSAPEAPSGEASTAASETEARHRRISEAAYYRAERRGFEPGGEHDDWLEAERELDHSEQGTGGTGKSGPNKGGKA